MIAEAVGFTATGSSSAGSNSGCSSGDLGQCLSDVQNLPSDALHWVASKAGGAVADVAGSAWDSICRSFVDAFTTVLQWFGGVFASMPDPDIGSIRGVYAISLTLGMIVALILLIIQAGAVVWTRSGAPLAQALTGLVKAGLAAMFTLAVAQQIMRASDSLAHWIVAASGTSMDGFSKRLIVLFTLSSGNGPEIPSVMLLIFGLLGIAIVLTLWFELVLRNAVFCVLVATAPISAAGQVGSVTQEWWRKLVKAGVQLALLKPVVALVFVIGLDMEGHSDGITSLVSGFCVLFMAVFAWPAVARFFTFAGTAMGGAMGVGALVGAVANRSAGGGPGIDPGGFGKFSERQAMSANAARGGGGGADGGAASGGIAGGAGSSSAAGAKAAGGGGASAAAGGGGGAAAGAATAAGAAAGPAGIAMAALQTLHKSINAVASRMEQQAGHAGLDGSNPTAYPGGYPSYGSVRVPKSGSGQSPQPSGQANGPEPRGGASATQATSKASATTRTGA
ncbi:hypothetical protein KDK95_14645 [Actinospica sp. MGRD01-02]|uniref:Conjugal transfer protein TrbL n=1 Tax=Actinospica acidithermotolerans TaxID=2828514 RepID=A0A941EH55_9ACTN|nr:hypothetical protein [Actinospica acidithermotolerans]MBR7827554.1 hypothetical protein [Actinospica acidithermotolerans]